MPQALPRPDQCFTCQRLRNLSRLRLQMRLCKEGDLIAIRTWCRVCGNAVFLEVALDYDVALRNFYGLDDQVMTCNRHEEVGGWGVHWRFDDVLRLVFPSEFQLKSSGGYWPKPPWYSHARDGGRRVEFVSQSDMRKLEERVVDSRRLQIMEELNSRPRSREELEGEVGQVWDAQEVAADFDILGYRAPFVVAVHKATGRKGSLVFQHKPRFYFAFEEARLI